MPIKRFFIINNSSSSSNSNETAKDLDITGSGITSNELVVIINLALAETFSYNPFKESNACGESLSASSRMIILHTLSTNEVVDAYS